MKLARDFAAFKSVGAWVITHPDRDGYALVQAHYGQSRVTVTVWDFERTGTPQTASANGGGYDRVTAALAGMTIGGHTLSDHCGLKAKGGYQTAGLDYLREHGFSVIAAA